MKTDRQFMTLLLCALLCSATAFSAVILDHIRIENAAGGALDESFVQAYTSLRAGQEVESEAELNAAVARDVDNLRRSERFSFVRAALEQDDATLTLVYQVAPRLRLKQMKISGAEGVGNRRIRQQLELEMGDYIDEALVGEKVRKAEAYLRKNKYPDASIVWSLSPDEAAGTVDLLLAVNEGSKARVSEIRFEGGLLADGESAAGFLSRLKPVLFPSKAAAARITARDLQKVIQQKKTWWITPWFGTYHPEFAEADSAALRSFYRNRGHLDVQVEGPLVRELGDGQLELTYRISEGPDYTIGTTAFDGVTLFDLPAIEQQVRLIPGTPASQEAIDEAAAAVNRYYGNRGYINNRVRPVIDTDPATAVANIRFNVQEGEQASINEINIRGNEKTRDVVVRRELAVYPGEMFHQGKVETSERRLQNLGYFETVSSSYTPADKANAYDLTFLLKEKAMGSFLIGAGFSSEDSLVGFAELSHGNFDIRRWPPVGDGQKMKVRVQAGTERNDAEISFVEPWFMDRKLALGTDLYMRNNGYYSDNYQLETLGGRLSLTRQLNPFTRGTLSYSLENFKVYDVTAPPLANLWNEEGSRIKSSVGFKVSRDTRDQFFIPTRGNLSSAGIEFAGGPLGGDTDIYMLEAKSSQFWPVLDDHVFNLKGSVATVDAYSGEVPIFDRLFLGGPRTIRAFAYRDVSPRDPNNNDEPDGGLSSWYATAEYTVPLWSKIRAAAFYDIGAVGGSSFDWFGSDINSGYGIGARFDLPMFPLRLDYAIPHITDDANQDTNPRWSFLLGYSF